MAEPTRDFLVGSLLGNYIMGFRILLFILVSDI